jgi:hypothetical protein
MLTAARTAASPARPNGCADYWHTRQIRFQASIAKQALAKHAPAFDIVPPTIRRENRIEKPLLCIVDGGRGARVYGSLKVDAPTDSASGALC